MDRIIAANSVSLGGADTAPVSGTPQYATSGNPGTGTPATVFPAYQYNAIQEELIAIINAAGLSPDRTNNAQVLAALRAIFVGRIKLSGSLTLYVSTTGNDANNGLTSGTPFLTIQKAWNTLASNYDLNGQTATIQLADGTYTGALNAVGPLIGQSSPVIINGHSGSSSSVVLSPASGTVPVTASNGANITIQNLQVQSAGGVSCLLANVYSQIVIGAGIIFGAASGSGFHCNADGGYISGNQNYTISGGGAEHWLAQAGGIIGLQSITITLSGTPAFSNAFAVASDAGRILCASNTFSGSATGSRYNSVGNGNIETNGAGSTYLPGNAGGTGTTTIVGYYT